MPNETHEATISKSVQDVWNFLQDIHHWAPLIPGYIEHEVIDDNQFTWKFRADLGMLQKNIVMQVDLVEKSEPSQLAFNLKGLNESLEGNGYFKLDEAEGNTTKLIGYLDISGKGMMGSMINTMMKSYVPQTVQDLTVAIAEKNRV